MHVVLFEWIDRPSKKVKWSHHAKPINLDLLLGPNAAYALGVHRSMILSRLETLFKRCSELQDYISEVDKFYQNLLNVRFNPSFLTKTFKEAADRISIKICKTGNNTSRASLGGGPEKDDKSSVFWTIKE